jgi:hypothetical protein
MTTTCMFGPGNGDGNIEKSPASEDFNESEMLILLLKIEKVSWGNREAVLANSSYYHSVSWFCGISCEDFNSVLDPEN